MIIYNKTILNKFIIIIIIYNNNILNINKPITDMANEAIKKVSDK